VLSPPAIRIDTLLAPLSPIHLLSTPSILPIVPIVTNPTCAASSLGSATSASANLVGTIPGAWPRTGSGGAANRSWAKVNVMQAVGK
jgi:hypothetical protein